MNDQTRWVTAGIALGVCISTGILQLLQKPSLARRSESPQPPAVYQSPAADGPSPVVGVHTAGLPSPELLSPSPGESFDIYPRVTRLEWKALPAAATYSLEVDCFHCCEAGKWCSDVGKVRINASGIKEPAYTFNWVGANLGRWRVWGVDENGRVGPKSEWREFSYRR